MLAGNNKHGGDANSRLLEIFEVDAFILLSNQNSDG
jgi:hypothetical protein